MTIYFRTRDPKATSNFLRQVSKVIFFSLHFFAISIFYGAIVDIACQPLYHAAGMAIHAHDVGEYGVWGWFIEMMYIDLLKPGFSLSSLKSIVSYGTFVDYLPDFSVHGTKARIMHDPFTYALEKVVYITIITSPLFVVRLVDTIGLQMFPLQVNGNAGFGATISIDILFTTIISIPATLPRWLLTICPMLCLSSYFFDKRGGNEVLDSS